MSEQLRPITWLCYHPDDEWQRRHMKAIQAPMGPEVPIVHMLDGWVEYACRHSIRYESGIGEDGVLGLHWRDIGVSLLGLLNGECGRLDCGTLDSIIRHNLTAEGFDPDV